MLKRFFLCFLFIIALVTNAFAVSFSKTEDMVALKVTPEYKILSPDITEITLISTIDIKSGWHLYWDNPGDTGEPTTLTFFESPYYEIVENVHSAPQKSVFDEIITSYIHTKKLYHKTTFKIKNLHNLSELPFSLVLSYTACSESCLPGAIKLDLVLPITKKHEKNPIYLASLLEAENTFPILLNANIGIKDKFLELQIEENILKDCSEPEFVSRHPKKSVLEDLPTTSIADKKHLHVSFNSNVMPPDFKGVLLCPEHAYYLDPLKKESPISPTKHSATLLYYILTAFVAGLILNLMPCVLPVLGLKALYLAENSQKASAISAFMYLTGVVLSFLVLSGILFYLREKGVEMGWGFQLQSPVFNIILFLLFFVIFLNLTDKLALPDKCADYFNKLAGNKSFLTGFFAVIIACPCTGPFMGAALGYAITQPATIYFAIFIALAIGYALPYTLIELFPKFFLRYIPKPGGWMITLKKVLALPIALTCLWLAWVIYNQLKPTTASQDINWEKYSAENVQKAINNNEAVFINFTAKWCLVCLLNDRTTLSSETFKTLAKENNIRLFKADWTNRDEKIRDALKNYGRNSIPLYVYYSDRKQVTAILPQILTTDIVREYFAQ